MADCEQMSYMELWTYRELSALLSPPPVPNKKPIVPLDYSNGSSVKNKHTFGTTFISAQEPSLKKTLSDCVMSNNAVQIKVSLFAFTD